jgi:hypothetical protein
MGGSDRRVNGVDAIGPHCAYEHQEAQHFADEHGDAKDLLHGQLLISRL